jgi:hypothetical protein
MKTAVLSRLAVGECTLGHESDSNPLKSIRENQHTEGERVIVKPLDMRGRSDLEGQRTVYGSPV